MNPGSNPRSPFMLPVMILFSLAFLIFLAVLVNFVTRQSPNPTIESNTPQSTYTLAVNPSPSSTSTITLTPRPTWTLRPSATATLTPSPTSTTTSTLIRTLTPVTPARLNTFYELKPWDLADQQRTIELLKTNTILLKSNETLRALAYAEGEGIIRFPDSLDATQWSWDRAYNLIRIGDSSGISLYSDLIQNAIDTGQTPTRDLPSWFDLYETRLSLKISAFPAQTGELGREIVEIIGDGSAYLWVVEKPSGTKIYPLINDIDYQNPHQNATVYGDLTNDGSPDLVIYRRSTPGMTQLFTPHIFDLSTSPPTPLPIQDQVPMDFGLEPIVNAEILVNDRASKFLSLMFTLLPACPVNVSQEYSWEGASFSTKPFQYEMTPIAGLTAYCQLAFDEATSSWGPEPAITLGDAMLGDWPPATDTQGHPYPSDAIDQLQYRIAIEYALAGQMDRAKETMAKIINTPSLPGSDWVRPAEAFLRAYPSQDDLFVACQQAQFCSLRDAFEAMVRNSASQDFQQVIAYIQSHGVTIRSSGLMDFDLDGKEERWLIIQPKPGEKLEFWILYRAKAQVQAIFVQVFEAGEILPFFHEPAGATPIFQFELHKGYIFKYLPNTDLAYVQPVDVEFARPTFIREGLQGAVNDLMAGKDPNNVSIKLMELFNSPRFAGDCIAFNICDLFHYTLALAYDMAGQSDNAIDEYMWVWRNYGKSQYALMARLKMNYFPLPTYTRTPFLTSTVAPTRTTTITPTRTVTNTPTTTRTTTPTLTSTPTPTETVTSTPTQAVSP